MSDVSIFNLGGQDIHVKDAIARSKAQSADTAATGAATTANEALQKVKEVEKLARVTVEYAASTETIKITTATHTTTASN